MANTVSTLSYANTFGEWVVATQGLIAENNTLAKSDYTKDSGTLYLNETTQNSLQANGSLVVQKELRVQGTGSSANIYTNLFVGGQIYFTNTAYGLTHAGQANLNGPVIVNGANYGISVANNAYVGGNTNIKYNTVTDKLQANTSVSTVDVYATNITANSKIYANNATAYVKGVVVGSDGLTVSGNFVLTGQTVYAANTFLLSSGVNTALNSYYNVDRGSSGRAASIRWNENLKYWEMLDVDGAAYYRILWSKEIPLPINEGGTGAISASGALSALTSGLPNASIAGYVLATGGPGNYYWAAGGTGGGGGATPGTTINSTRLSYIANGVSGYSGNSFTTPVFSSTTQVRAYINGVRQFESEYNLNQSANTISFTTTPPNGDNILIEVDGYVYNPYYANNIGFTTPFGEITDSSNTIQLAIQSLETRKAALSGAAFSNVVTGITVSDPSVSNTAFATTAYVQSVNSYASGVTAGIYGGGVTASNHQVPILTINAQGKVTQASNVTVTSTSVYANSTQLTANASVGVVALGLPVLTSGQAGTTFGSGTQTPQIVVDAYGRIVSIQATTITGGSAGIGATTYNRQSYTASAAQTTFTVTSGYTVGYLLVYLNGVLLNASDYTASNGTTFVLGAAASAGDIVESFAYTVTLVNNVSPTYAGGQGGAGGTVLYQSAANTTANTAVGTATYLLQSNGSAAPTWVNPGSLLVNNVSPTYAGGQGGAAGQVLYQSAANTTANTAVGTATYLLQSNGSGAPTWVNPGSLAVNTANTLSTTTSNTQFFSIGVGTAASTSNGEIRATGTITAGYSDDQLKTKLGNIDNALDKLMTLNGFYYEPSQLALDLGYTPSKQVGVSAQEVQKVLPEVVVPAPINDKYLTVHYDRLIPLLVEAIKELKSEVEILKGQIK